MWNEIVDISAKVQDLKHAKRELDRMACTPSTPEGTFDYQKDRVKRIRKEVFHAVKGMSSNIIELTEADGALQDMSHVGDDR